MTERSAVDQGAAARLDGECWHVVSTDPDYRNGKYEDFNPSHEFLLIAVPESQPSPAEEGWPKAGVVLAGKINFL